MNFTCFFFKDTATTDIYTLSLHDALPICSRPATCFIALICALPPTRDTEIPGLIAGDRKSTRLNSSHSQISYAAFCLKKKKDWVTSKAIAVVVYDLLF